jgi:DNA-directed RNA polymerase subunit L
VLIVSANQKTAIYVEKYTQNFLELKIEGEGHTLLNLIVDELNSIPNVEAAYRVDHPLLKTARLMIRTSGSKSPLDAFREATENIKNKLEELKKQVAQHK